MRVIFVKYKIFDASSECGIFILSNDIDDYFKIDDVEDIQMISTHKSH